MLTLLAATVQISFTESLDQSVFVESLKRPSKLIFVVLNFVTAISTGAWHCCISDDVIDTCARDLLRY